MRRFICCLLLCLCLAAPCALAQDNNAYGQILDAVQALGPDDVQFMENGDWLSVRITRGKQVDGRTFSLLTGESIAWDELFIDGDAAAERIEALVEESVYDNAYAANREVSPVPRDSFTVADGVITIYYPANQLSHFSDWSMGFSFYAYELDGLLAEGVPLSPNDPAVAKSALSDILTSGAMPWPLADWQIGSAMADAVAALRLVDVPDLTHDFAVYNFEAPEMRGVSLLSLTDDDNPNTATIAGIMATHIDFLGLCTGATTKDECAAALGEPTTVTVQNDADGYSRLPDGETLTWTQDGNAVDLHFVEGVLNSVTLRKLTN